MTSTFTAQIKDKYKNRITIPIEVVRAEDIQPGDFIEVAITKKEKKK